MASCTKCGAALVTQARFCATCGSPVASASVIPPPDPNAKAKGGATDPFAKTVLKDEAEPALAYVNAARAVSPVSPMAASVMATPPQRTPSNPPPSQQQAQRPPQAQHPPQPQPQPRPNPAAPAREPSRSSTEYAPPLPMATHSFGPGALVLVYWADGNRYPGTVVQAAPNHVYVVFPNGQQHWIDVRYVTSGS
jgi:hypothetical protein